MKHHGETFSLANGVAIPCLGFGTWQMKEGPETVAAIQKALELGYRHIDTAAYYQNERSVGQAVRDLGAGPLGLDDKAVSAFTSTALIFLSALLTGLGLYDRIGKFAGAGSIVPITGFANSVVSPAMEFKREGYVLGVGAKMFVVAGPVLVYGITASVLYGVIYYAVRLVQGG